MPIVQLRSVVALADMGSLPAASRHLGVGRGTLLRAVHQLELRVGTRLVADDGLGLLTAAGRTFVDAARRTLHELTDFERLARNALAGAARELTIAVTRETTIWPLVPIVAGLDRTGASHPVRVVECADAEEAADCVRSADADLGVVPHLDPPDLVTLALGPERRSLVVPASWGAVGTIGRLRSHGTFPLVSEHREHAGRVALDGLRRLGLEPVPVLPGLPPESAIGLLPRGVAAVLVAPPLSRVAEAAGGLVVGGADLVVGRISILHRRDIRPRVVSAVSDLVAAGS